MGGVSVFAQSASISGEVFLSDGMRPVAGVDVMLDPVAKVVQTNKEGLFTFENLKSGKYRVTVTSRMFEDLNEVVELKVGQQHKIKFKIDSLLMELDEIQIHDQYTDFGFGHLKAIDGMAIYAGKKSEVIYLQDLPANLATNSSRQVFAKVAGLNIWESDGAGLQLGIGGRGLNPNRTSNFNVRQNGYDISADALGYPESYYTPPMEALQKIEVVRGAASLQYGTQFGGMLNFVFKEGAKDRPMVWTSRQTVGSFGFFNSFNSVGGSTSRVNYYAYYQYKRGNGWRDNSGFDVHNAFASIKYHLSQKIRIGTEFTMMHYLTRQPGGLTDALFNSNPRQSIRDRNWFRVNWNLAAATMDYEISENTKLNVRSFGLVARRDALGFLGLITRTDPMTERDLLVGHFRNYGAEARLMHRFDINDRPSAFLAGVRYYKGHTRTMQGLANDGAGPDFDYLNPTDLENSDYRFPNRNMAAFTEVMLSLSDKFTVTPGARFEYIHTTAEGFYKETVEDLAGNIIYEETFEDSQTRRRYIPLLGLGTSFEASDDVQLYSNISQNYRAINFNDLRVVNPNQVVDPNIRDERGFNMDLGVRGEVCQYLNFDFSVFYLWYSDRIGTLLQRDTTLFNLYRYRTNIANSRNYGFESLIEFDFVKCFSDVETKSSFSAFSNISLINAKYVAADGSPVAGKDVELVPPFNLKCGVSYRYENFRASAQYGYTASHFTDATNAEFTPNAVNGLIPSYDVVDLSFSYGHKWLRLEAGVNNLLNRMYFTRRASGYPGPGIIPSDGRSFWFTIQVSNAAIEKMFKGKKKEKTTASVQAPLQAGQ